MKKINFAFTGHTSVGKTSLIDTLLYDTGAVDTIGRVDEGKSLSDYDEEEIKRKISIYSSVFSIPYDNSILNIIDTPGSSDFVGEVVSALYGIDSVILVIDAVSGVEIETAKIWSRTKAMGLPVMILLNKMDKERADHLQTIENIRKNLQIKVLPLQLPIGRENNFRGVVDIIRMKAFVYDGSLKRGKEQEIPAELKEEAESFRSEIIESAAEANDALTEKYLEGKPFTQDEIIAGLRERISRTDVVPLFLSSAILNRGIIETLDIIKLLAPPSNYKGKIKAFDANDRAKEVEREKSRESEFTGLVFKTVIDQFAGKISFLRVLSGVLRPEEDVLNTTKDKKERVSKLGSPFGKVQKPLAREAEEGDIIVLTKLPYAETGDTLCALSRPIILPAMNFPHPVHSVAIRAKNKKEDDKLNSLLQRAAEEDISFNVNYNKETKQTVISGMGELQFNIILSRIKDKYGIEFITSTPLVAYRETIQSPAKADYKHKKQTGGHGQYGEVFLEIEPLPRGGGFEFIDKIVGGVIPKGYIPGVEKGVREALEEGVLAGYPVVDVRVSLVFGSYHEVDSSELSFKIAGRQAFKLAMAKANPTLLEPIMNLNVYISDQYTGDIISDLNSKRGRVLGIDNIGGGIQLIRAKVPQAELLKYSIELRSMTSGTGSFDMEFSHYEPIGGKIAEDVINETKRRREAEAKEK
ncbi:MAG: elongation factor G [Spirochaetota bacterium]